jgi:hypothetical protein
MVHALRVAEAKQVLRILGLPLSGRKDELHERILAVFEYAEQR